MMRLSLRMTFWRRRRCFLHYPLRTRDNTLEWHAQDEAAGQSIGLETRGTPIRPTDAHLLPPCRERYIAGQIFS